MSASTTPSRCRLVLVASPRPGEAGFAGRILAAIGAGDVASLILDGAALDEASFQSFAEAVVAPAQALGIAVMVSGDTRIAGRVGADGVHLETGKADVAETIDKFDGQMMVGAGGAKTRDDALELGEARPDYIFFGRFGHDAKPGPHPRNLALGGWWAEMIEIPCIVQGGSDLASVADVAATGAEFVALSAAVFGEGVDAAAAIAEANAILDRDAPSFGAPPPETPSGDGADEDGSSDLDDADPQDSEDA